MNSGGSRQFSIEDSLQDSRSNPAPVEKAISSDRDTDNSELSPAIIGNEELCYTLAETGTELAALIWQLELEGIEKFNAPYQKLLNAIQTQRAKDQAWSRQS